MKPGTCDELLCDAEAAWGASKRSAWCQNHAVQRFRQKGVEPLEPVQKLTTFTLTRCLTCGCEAHYKLDYALTRHDPEEGVCRACYWKKWAENSEQWGSRVPADLSQVRELADENGYEYLGPLTSPALGQDPHHVRCRFCQRLSAERPGDIAWGCGCQRRTRKKSASAPSANISKKPNLFKDSNNAALAWWDYELNDPHSLATATIRATRQAHWVCPKCDHHFIESVRRMAELYPSCPLCRERERAEHKKERDYYSNLHVFDVPELLAAWADEQDPRQVSVTQNFPLSRFVCAKGHHPRITPYTFLKSGCPHCRSDDTRAATDMAIEQEPEMMRLDPETASQWHPTANDRLDIRKISPTSKREVTWLCHECGHTWVETPKSRSYASALRCPVCRSIFDSLAYHHPDLAAEWSPDNPMTAWQVRPSSNVITPTWVCSADPAHIFMMALASRTKGGTCPECSEHGKSKTELDHHAAAKKAFGNATSGKRIATGKGSTARTWRPDITVKLADGSALVIEYDGSYWHKNKQEVDVRKSEAILNAGHRVVRLREHPLGPLPIEHERYLELQVYPTTPDPEGVMKSIMIWTET